MSNRFCNTKKEKCNNKTKSGKARNYNHVIIKLAILTNQDLGSQTFNHENVEMLCGATSMWEFIRPAEHLVLTWSSEIEKSTRSGQNQEAHSKRYSPQKEMRLTLM